MQKTTFKSVFFNILIQAVFFFFQIMIKVNNSMAVDTHKYIAQAMVFE